MRLPCQFRGWLALGRPPGCVAWSALRGPVDWLERLRGEVASAAGTIGACFQPGIVRLGASAGQALRPLRGGLRPAWTTAAPSPGLAAMKGRPEPEPGGALAGRVTAWLEADAPRVACPEHGVVTAAVPWARHGAAHTRFFDDQVAWLAAACSKTTITQLMRISWRTVGHIIARVTAEQLAAAGPLAGLTRIGIDEISYKRGHKYIVVVVDHDTGRLVWAAPRREAKTVAAFFDALGEQRAAALTHVSADGADWISGVVAARAPQAVLCADPFHVVSWATGALDEVPREAWRQAPAAGQT